MTTSAEEYRRQVAELVEGLTVEDVQSVDDAKMALNEVRHVQMQLRHVKRNVDQDIKSMRAQFRQENTQQAGGSGVTVLRGGGRFQSEEGRRLRVLRGRTLEPYETVKRSIDGFLVEMDDLKLSLQRTMKELKALEQAKKQAPTSSA